MRYIYRGPSDVLVVGRAVLIRNGEPVFMAPEEVERVRSMPGHRIDPVAEPKKDKRPVKEVKR